MYSAAAAWLMTELTTDPLLVSLVQVATSLPMFLFAVVAGALTDIVDKSSICGSTGASPRADQVMQDRAYRHLVEAPVTTGLPRVDRAESADGGIRLNWLTRS
jgi:hypothetical protein